MAAKRYTRRPARRSARARRGTIRLGVVLAVLVGVNLYVFLWRGGTSIPDVREAAMAAESTEAAGGEVEATGEESGLLGIPALGRELPEGDEAPEDQGEWMEGEVGRGDSLGRILKRHGFTPQQTDEVVRALRPHMDFRSIRAGQSYRLHTRDDGEIDRFEFQLSRETKVTAVRGEDGELAGEKIDAETEVKRHALGGVIETSLYDAIKTAGEDMRLVAGMVDIFAYDLNFFIDQHKGDRFKMLVEKEYLKGDFLRYQKVRAAEWVGRAGTFRAFWWKSDDGKVQGYYDDEGRSIAKTFLKTPLKFGRVSSKFDRNRMHPILHKRRAHLGVDYAAPKGTPIWAAASGRIVQRGYSGGAGNRIELDHGNGYRTVYMHLSKFRKGQKRGDTVKQKTVIGYVGSTGMSTGPHLHFSVKKHGRYIDPMKMKMKRGPPIPKKYREAFDRDVEALVAEMSMVPQVPAAAAVIETASE